LRSSLDDGIVVAGTIPATSPGRRTDSRRFPEENRAMADTTSAARLENIDRRLARVEQILPTLATRKDLERLPTVDDPKGFATTKDLKKFATKDDLRRFATKDDLKRFATKDDLKKFATKDDLKKFATKDDLKRFPTKDDLKKFATQDDLKRFATKDDLKGMPTVADPKGFATKADLQQLRRDIKHDVLVLLEAERDRWRALMDAVNAVLEQMPRIDRESQARDAALDRRVQALEMTPR
jgi:hypothetical protein